jgi:hypothetical protein
MTPVKIHQWYVVRSGPWRMGENSLHKEKANNVSQISGVECLSLEIGIGKDSLPLFG